MKAFAMFIVLFAVILCISMVIQGILAQNPRMIRFYGMATIIGMFLFFLNYKRLKK